MTLLLTLRVAGSAAAQSVRGAVTDAISGTPIYTADLVMLDAAGSVVGHATTSDDGRFWIRAPSPGSYAVRATRIGYDAFTADSLTLSPGENASVEIRLQPTPAELASVDVLVGRRSARLAREGFYHRMAKGIGYFLRPEDLEKLKPLFPADLFYGMPGVRVVGDRSVRSRSLGCGLRVAIDGVRVVADWTDVVHVRDIEAIEVYPRPAGVPFWLFGTGSECGALVIWTKS